MLRQFSLLLLMSVAVSTLPQGKFDASKCLLSSMDIMSVLDQEGVAAVVDVTQRGNYRNQEEFNAIFQEKYPEIYAKLAAQQEQLERKIASMSEESQTFLNKYLPRLKYISIEIIAGTAPAVEELQAFHAEYFEAVNGLSQAAKNELIEHCFSVVPGQGF